jgi:hypothetical protein
MNDPTSDSRIPPREPVRTKDHQGQTIVHIKLNDGTQATTDPQSYNRLINRGVSTFWFLNSNANGKHYVRVQHQGRVQTVSRLITDAPANSNVRSINGDPRDLRKQNLKVISHRTKGGGYRV